MDTASVSYTIVTLIILLSLSAFFSAAETSFISLNKLRLRSLVDSGVKNADKVQKLLEEPDKLISTILIMNNLVNITASSVTTMLMLELYGDAGVSIATGLVTLLVLIFGEITPKTIAIQNAEKFALKMVGIMRFIVIILTPIVKAFGFISSIVCTLTRSKNDNESVITEEELKTMVEVSEENGVLDVSEKEMIYNVFDFGDLIAKDIMVQKTNITAIDIDSKYTDVINIIKQEKYSRIPVYKQSLDSIVGILYIKDLIFKEIDEDNFQLSDYIKPSYTTFEFKNVQDLFKEMKKNKNHMSIVLDEYGVTKGIVTMEDLIEEIVGDIDDEYDTQEDKDVIKINPKAYIVSGSMRVYDIIEQLQLPLTKEDDGFDSVGGLFIKHLDRFPNVKEFIIKDDIKFTVIEIEKNTIKKVKVEIL